MAARQKQKLCDRHSWAPALHRALVNSRSHEGLLMVPDDILFFGGSVFVTREHVRHNKSGIAQGIHDCAAGGLMNTRLCRWWCVSCRWARCGLSP
jgi:hypothetical protein